MVNCALTRRTGRVIATARAALALFFLLVASLDPAGPLRGAQGILLVMTVYLLWTALLMMIAWRSWWFDFRLAPLAQGIDIIVVLATVSIGSNGYSGSQSPLLVSSAFLLVAATTRWGWRATVMTALGLLLADLVAALSILQMGFNVDLFRFARSTAQLMVLASLMVWLGLARSGGCFVQFSEPPGMLGERLDRLLDAGLTQIASVMGARQVVLAFAASEEPWVEFRHRSPAGITVRRVGPAEFGDQLNVPTPTTLFNVGKSRMITLELSGVKILKGPVRSQLTKLYGIDEGILVPLRTATGDGHIVAWDCETLSVDDLPVLHALGDQIGHAMDREEMASMARNAAEAGVRHAVARDLHDSVAQFLAGTLFRLEALRRWIREGHEPEGEIYSIKNALRREQAHLRHLIERLRRGEAGDRRTEIADELRALLQETGTHWQIGTELVMPDHSPWVSVQLSHEIRQLVREAIANAVRHGKCSKVWVELSDEDGVLKLSISDDGTGFPNPAAEIRPRSISERVEALGGQFHVGSTSKGARLDIAIRTGEFA